MIISFAGHAMIPSKNQIKEKVKEIIRQSIANEQRVTCYLGGYGDFDAVCAAACRELKAEYTGIETVFVTPYLTVSNQRQINELLHFDLYDTVLYPPLESVPPRFSISKRNEWMMSQADLIIAYVDHNYGGAYKSLQVAKRKSKRIINIFT